MVSSKQYIPCIIHKLTQVTNALAYIWFLYYLNNTRSFLLPGRQNIRSDWSKQVTLLSKPDWKWHVLPTRGSISLEKFLLFTWKVLIITVVEIECSGPVIHFRYYLDNGIIINACFMDMFFFREIWNLHMSNLFLIFMNLFFKLHQILRMTQLTKWSKRSSVVLVIYDFLLLSYKHQIIQWAINYVSILQVIFTFKHNLCLMMRCI